MKVKIEIRNGKIYSYSGGLFTKDQRNEIDKIALSKNLKDGQHIIDVPKVTNNNLGFLKGLKI